ncbi:tektin-4-like isoform X2 [Diachasmimorpha longicaudata]|uniref:tektin-4-like isoform X2 n=1 Tax=Diachasmimorpha longicaudata TaxID=58733 RepID=UPI0030B8D5F2
MLQRNCLDERCAGNDPGRVREVRCDVNKRPTGDNGVEKPEIEPCGVRHLGEPQVDPTVDVLQNRMNEEGKSPPPYLPQASDDLPCTSEETMGPIGPWATGRVVFTPTAGITGVRPVVDRYSVTRYSPAEWRAHNQTFFDKNRRTIDEAQFVAEKTRENNSRIYKTTDTIQLENRDRLSKRSSVIHRWKTELEKALHEITDEIELLEGELRRVKQSLSILTLPESIAGEFLDIRCQRLEPDLVRDKVEEELVKEVALCNVVRSTLTRTRESVEYQLLELRTAKARLEFDITDKLDAYEIDSLCVSLRNDSPLILMKPGATRVPPEQSTPESYDHFTSEALANAEAVRQTSIHLRKTLNDIYVKAVKDLRSQAMQVDKELAEKVSQTEQVCQQLEKELSKCLNQLSATENLIEEFRGAAKGLNEALKVAQTRLHERLYRRNVEGCRDEPQYGLIEEVKTIGENLSVMSGQLTRAEETQADLVKSRNDLEREIFVKRKTLFVDRDRGQLLRSYYPSAEALSGLV